MDWYGKRDNLSRSGQLIPRLLGIFQIAELSEAVLRNFQVGRENIPVLSGGETPMTSQTR